MLHGVLPRDGDVELQRPHRERARFVEVARAMLVVNRERLRRFARNRGRTAAQSERAPPCAGGILVAARSP